MPGRVKVSNPGLSFFTDELNRDVGRPRPFGALKERVLHGYWYCLPPTGLVFKLIKRQSSERQIQEQA